MKMTAFLTDFLPIFKVVECCNFLQHFLADFCPCFIDINAVLFTAFLRRGTTKL